MLAATAFSLVLPEAAEQLGYSRAIAALTMLLGIGLGALFLELAHRYFPHEHVFKGVEGKSNLARIWLFVIAITLHNFPEGLAVGVSFGAGNIDNGLAIAFGMALQNIPEGLVVALASWRRLQPPSGCIAANGLSRTHWWLCGCQCRPRYSGAWPLPLGPCCLRLVMKLFPNLTARAANVRAL